MKHSPVIFEADVLTSTMLQDFCNKCHDANSKWWFDLDTGKPLYNRNRPEMIALAHSELSEAYLAYYHTSKDDHLPSRSGFIVEVVDMCIRLGDYTGGLGIQLPEFKVTKQRSYPSLHPHSFLLDSHLGLSQLLELERKGLPTAEAIKNIFIHVYNSTELLPRFDTIWQEKMEYNSKRADHKLKNRKKEGGKKI